MRERSIMWFRRDLRLHDHPALAEACAAGEVLPVFVVDPAFAAAGAPRRALLHDVLTALDAATGGALVIRHGDPVEEIAVLAEECGAGTVYVTRDYGPYGRRRDAAVADVLRGAGRRLRGVDSPYAVAPGSIRKDDGTPYAVFTAYLRRWRTHGRGEPIAAPRAPEWITAESDGLFERPEVDIDVPVTTETAAAGRWDRFRAHRLDDYRRERDRPAVDGTSRLSTALKYGVLHPRRLLAESDAGRDDTARSSPRSPGGTSTPTCCSTPRRAPGSTGTGGSTPCGTTPDRPPRSGSAAGAPGRRASRSSMPACDSSSGPAGCTTGCGW